MMKFSQRFFCFLLLSGICLFTGCAGRSVFEGSSSAYDYVPPVLPTPTPRPGELPARKDSADSEAAPRRSLFRRMFFSTVDEDSSGAGVTRVGERPIEEPVPADGKPEITFPLENIYRLTQGDSIIINLSGSGGLSESIETRVDDQGNVKLRFIGSVRAAGRGTTELEREIELEYTERQKIYKDVTVRVVVPHTFYFIGGEVRQPGRFPLIGRVTLGQAVVAAGNFTEWANDRRVILVRNNERSVINFREIRRDPSLDVELLAGDRIEVERSNF